MNRRWLLFAAIAVCFGILIGLPSASAMAVDTGSEIVLDEAQILGNQIGDIEAAAKKLESIGADVRVRTFTDFGNAGTLDAFIEQYQKQYSSWLGANGERKNNLLIFAVSMKESKLGIFYGDQWMNALEYTGEGLRISSDLIGPKFTGGNFVDGFLDGMNETYRVLNDYLHPSATTGTDSSSPVVIQKEPTDLSGLWIFLYCVAGAIFMVIAFFVVRAIGRRLVERREERQEAEATRQRALRARDAATLILSELSDPNRQAVRKAKVEKYSTLSESVESRLQEALNVVIKHLDDAQTGMASAVSASAVADDKNLSEDVYVQMADRYEEVLSAARTAQKADQLIDGIANEIEADLKQIPGSIAKMRQRLAKLDKAVAVQKKDGIRVDMTEDYVLKISKQLDKANQGKGDLATVKLLASLNSDCAVVEADLAKLEQSRKQVSEAIPKLQKRADLVRTQVESAKTVFDRIAAGYAESSWESVRGNVTEAQKRIMSAESLIQAATTQSSVDKQNWKEAVESVEQASLALDEAESYLRSIVALEGNLKQAKLNAPGEVSTAQADIDKARQYIAEYDEDIQDELETGLKEASANLEAAKQELQKSQPDYLLVVRLASQANTSADRIFEEAVDEHETAQRTKRQAASMLAQAKSAVSKAEEFIEDHQSDVGFDAESDLETAQRALQQALNCVAVAEILRYATQAYETADDAYGSAKSDFESAENSRYTPPVYGGGYRSSHDDDDSSGGGTSSSWGSGFGGGGGGISVGFGGGGGGGGSSVGF